MDKFAQCLFIRVLSCFGLHCSLRDNCPGLRHIDVVINNAGIYGPKIDIKTVTEQDMMQTYKTNTIGPLIVVQQLLINGLIGGFGGKTLVANVSSKVGSVDDNRGGGGYAYRASKSALNIVNKSMSIDLAGDGVTCVLLHPGGRQCGLQNVLSIST
jgi:NAD(P)-dependent dehydrogenase (short-subunit alcohol dehydrogenase family)